MTRRRWPRGSVVFRLWSDFYEGVEADVAGLVGLLDATPDRPYRFFYCPVKHPSLRAVTPAARAMLAIAKAGAR